MKKTLTLTEARNVFGEKTYETETGFLVNMFGKYQPNMTFVVGKEVELDATGKVFSPLTYVSDQEVTDNMNMDFGGSPTFMFGDFWRSKKGGACFRPKNPRVAKDLLVRVSWGGCFNSSRGNWKDEHIDGVKYYRRAASNGGGAGYDYWVVPVGFYRSLHIKEVDGDEPQTRTVNHKERARIYRERHAKIQEKASKANDAALKAKLAAEEKSRADREKFLPRLTAIEAQLAELDQPQQFGSYHVDRITFGETSFKHGSSSHLYTEENVNRAEQALKHTRDWIAEEEAKKQAKANARAAFEPKFEALRFEVEQRGWRISYGNESVEIYDPEKEARSYFRSCSGITNYSYTKSGFEELRADLEAEAERETERLANEQAAEKQKEAQEEAKKMGLPSDVQIWKRSGATNAGKGYVIMPNGMDRPRDDISGDPRRISRYDEGYEVWNQIMPGELVLEWHHECTAAEHEFYVIYRPDNITDAQLERVAEIQNGIEEAFYGKTSLTGNRSCPSIGQGWGLFKRKEANDSLSATIGEVLLSKLK